MWLPVQSITLHKKPANTNSMEAFGSCASALLSFLLSSHTHAAYQAVSIGSEIIDLGESGYSPLPNNPGNSLWSALFSN